MKKILLSLGFTIFLFAQSTAQQLVANAGTDTIACAGALVKLGGQPSASGGTPPYTYYWTPTAFLNYTDSNPIAQITSTKTYVLNVTDALSNTATDSINVTLDVFQVNGNPTDVVCFNQPSGSINAQVSTSGSGILYPPHTYSWSTGATTPQIQNLYAGWYSVTATDNLGCSSSASIQVYTPWYLTHNGTVINQSHFGACDGSIISNVVGGVTPYTYQWSNGATTPNITNLCPGWYSLMVTDANGCTMTPLSLQVGNGLCTNNTLNVSITSQDLSCSHPVDTMRAIVTGGTPPYIYYWGVSSGLTDTILVGHPGVYTVQVYDSVSCIKIVSDTVFDARLNVSLLSSHSASCNNISDGFAKLSVTGGIPPYNFTWSNGAPNTDSLVNVPAGIYSVTVIDNSVCSSVFTVNILDGATAWSYYVYVTPTSANCQNNGSAHALVNAGTPPFTYLWSNSDTAQTATNLAPGNYFVTVSGSDGCIRIGNTTIVASCNNIVNGYIYFDANNNCIKDSNETPISVGNFSISDSAGIVYHSAI